MFAIFLQQNSNLKVKAKEREDLGVNLFNLQEEVALSQRQIASYRKSLAEFEETRNNLEEELKTLQTVHKEEAKKISDLQMQGMFVLFKMCNIRKFPPQNFV